MIRAFLISIILATGPAQAETDPARIARNAAKKLDSAHRALNAANGASDRVAALTQTIQGYEDGLDALRQGLRRAAIRETAIRKSFDSESDKVSRLLGVLLSIQDSSGPLALLHPAGPLGTVRSGMILSEVTPALQKEVNRLNAQLEEVVVLRALQESAANSLVDGLRGVQQARTALSQAISNRTDLPQRFLSDPDQVQLLINSTETLDGFASGLAQIGPNDGFDAEIQGFENAMGTLSLPVSGTVLRNFDQPDAAGIRRPGLVVATQPLAVVTLPWASTVRYRGPLLDYGNVMILEPSADILLVLAGLNEVYGEIGQVLPPAAALGLMGGAEPDANTFLINSVNGNGSDQTETLYIELRINGDPVDPTQWFAETKE